MDDSLVVRRLDGLGDLRGNPERIFQWNWPQLNAIGERRSLDEFQDERLDGPAEAGPHVFRYLLEVVDRGDVWMIQRRENLRLAVKAREPVWIGRECVRQDLQRDIAIQLRIPGAIHLTHAACADRSDDFIRSEAGTWTQRHVMETGGL